MNIDPVTYEYYYEYYKKNNRFLDGQYNNPEKDLNDKQIKTKYNKYVKRFEKKLSKENSEYVQKVNEAMLEARRQDPAANLFWDRIIDLDAEWGTTYEEYFNKKNKILGGFYDPAHIIGRGRSPNLAYNLDNIIILPRFVHSLLDQYLEIFSIDIHKAISKERHEEIWCLLVGEERYNRLSSLR